MKKIITFILGVFMIFSLTACGETTEQSVETTTNTETTADTGHIYDKAEIVDSLNGSGDKIGEVSIIKAKSDEVTKEILEDWYFNYIQTNGDKYDYYLIVYTDKDSKGAYSMGVGVEDNVTLTENGDGTYSTNMDGTYYTATDDKKLKKEE